MYLKLRLKSAVCKHHQIDQAASVGNVLLTRADIKLTFGAEQLFVTGKVVCLSLQRQDDVNTTIIHVKITTLVNVISRTFSYNNVLLSETHFIHS